MDSEGTGADPEQAIKSAKFRSWFGESKVKNKNIPLVFYHGSKKFGIDPSKSWILDNSELGKNTKSPEASLGHFFAYKRDDAVPYAGFDGKVHEVYLRIENPLYIASHELPYFPSSAEAISYANRKKLQGYDGIFLTDHKHAIIFDSNQAKSATENTGEFSRDNDDIRYSFLKNSRSGMVRF